MATLYDIDNRIADLINTDTGEISDVNALDALLMERTAKIEGVVLAIKNKIADSAALENEIKALQARAAKNKKSIEGLQFWLRKTLEEQPFQTARCEVSFRKTSGQVEIENAAAIPEQYKLLKTTETISKTMVKDALTQGIAVPGARLNTQKSMKIL